MAAISTRQEYVKAKRKVNEALDAHADSDVTGAPIPKWVTDLQKDLREYERKHREKLYRGKPTCGSPSNVW